MKNSILMFTLTTAFVGCCALAMPSWATDHDGGGDCLKDPIVDWGDAPEGVLAYPGVIGKFPSCRQMNVVGTQELPPGCPPISTFPHVTGHIFHKQGPGVAGPSYWLGCYNTNGAQMGIDSEDEARVNQPAQGTSHCGGGPTDCVETAFGLTFDQDECYGDGSDAGLTSPPLLATCQPAALTFTTYSCATAPRQVVLNVLVDMNHDGDWNDGQLCGAGACAYEWVLKNQLIAIPEGCGNITSPTFLVGPTPGPSWMRISLTDAPVTDDFPWDGAAGLGGVIGGETEDYPVTIQQAVPALPSSWGKMKASYR
jgi:hypothetical protein